MVSEGNRRGMETSQNPTSLQRVVFWRVFLPIKREKWDVRKQMEMGIYSRCYIVHGCVGRES
jgi:hypothetical protein